jgi:hypothetical protein
VALMIQASDCGIFRSCIENAGKCGLAETGKHPVNENDEAMPHAILRARKKKSPVMNTGHSQCRVGSALRL